MNICAQNGQISTFDQKSDDTIVFADPDFLCDGGILAIRPQIWAKLHSFIAHAQNGLISTSCQKSDVIVVFPDPDFL